MDTDTIRVEYCGTDPGQRFCGDLTLTLCAISADGASTAYTDQALTVHVNALPVVSAQTFTGDEDTVMTVTLSGTDTARHGDSHKSQTGSNLHTADRQIETAL
jgi:hypothetical protein